MKKSKVILCLGLICLLCLSACAEADASGESARATVEEAETVESASAGEETERTGTESEEAEQTGAEQTGAESSEEPMRLNFTRFDNLPEAAKQVGYSFRALEEFADNGFRFQRFDISEEKQEVNGMELEEPCSVVKLQYKEGLKKIEMTIFPYEGATIQSALHKPICEVSTVEMNGIEVHLSEYILYMVPEDYKLTEEDLEIEHSGKGSFSCDGVSEGPDYFRAMYWVQDGIYYEMVVWVPNTPIEEIEQWVAEYMNAELQW